MVDKTKDKNLDTEIAKRLDDLFGEGDASFDDDGPLEAEESDSAENKPQNKKEDAEEVEILDLEEATANQADTERVPDNYPFAELKNLVLSIDWEITEEALVGLISEIDNLKNTHKNEKIILMFLQLLGSLGQYIKTNRSKAHPSTFKILNSVFSRLEEVVLADNMAVGQKKKLLRAEMQKYKQLRSQISKKKAAAVGGKETRPAAKAEPRKPEFVNQEVAATAIAGDPVAPQSLDTLAEAVEELKQFIHSELNALKQEVKKLQKSK